MTGINKTFLEKKGIKLSEVMYFTRSGRKTVINLADGSKVKTFTPIKAIIEQFPKRFFESINKGVVISPEYVVEVKNNEYLMRDGTVFHGRVRTTRQQKYNMDRYNGNCENDELEKFSVLDKMPLAFCIIELVYNENGHGIDFVFRYCNKEMGILEGKSVSEMMDKSLYEVFENSDKKLLVTYTDIAINGGSKVVETYSEAIGAKLKICCFQPKPNFCACALIKM